MRDSSAGTSRGAPTARATAPERNAPAAAQPAHGRARRQSGGELIKSYVHEAELRVAACRFARTGSQARNLGSQHGLHAKPNGPRFVEPGCKPTSKCLESRGPQAAPVRPSNQREANDKAPALLKGFFAVRRVHRRRHFSLDPDMLQAAMSAAVESSQTKPAFTFSRRKLQMESVSVQAAVAAASGTPRGPDSSHARPSTVSGQRPSSPPTPAVTTSQHLGQRPKASNLAAKLDAMLRSSPWMRRKVVVQHQNQGRTLRGLHKASSLRVNGTGNGNNNASPSSTAPTLTLQIPRGAAGSTSPRNSSRGPKVSHTVSRYRRVRHNNGYGANDPLPSDLEKRIMAAFRRIVRLWRERKRRAEQAALSIVNGGGNSVPASSASTGPTTGSASRTDSKLRREIDAQAYNVVSILSRRMISEVPALKFFDEGEPIASVPSSGNSTVVASTLDEGDATSAGPEDASTLEIAPQLPTLGEMMATSSLDGGLQTPLPHRATPKGVCYTLDSTGCRCIKMQAGAAQREVGTNSLAHKNVIKKAPELTVERAMAKSLRRKMTRRVKAKRMAIGRLTDDFRKYREELTTKLGAQLALRQAEGEKVFSKRLALLLSDDNQLPPHMAAKELGLARMRFKKINLLASCQTLALLGKVLHHVEAAGETSGLEISSGELHFLELLRCAVEGDHALTPLLADGIRGQLTAEQRQKPLVADLLEMMEQAVQAEY